MHLKKYFIKLLGGYTQLEFDSKFQDIKEDFTQDDKYRDNNNIQNYLDELSRNNLITIEKIDKLLKILKYELENNTELKYKTILDTYLEVRDLILRSNKTIIDLCESRNIVITQTNYISQIVTESIFDFFSKSVFHRGKKDEQYKIKILSQNIEVIATVETDIYFERSLGFCYRYTDLNGNTEFICPRNVEVISKYLELEKSQLI